MPRKPRRGCTFDKCSTLAVEGSQYCKEHKKLMDRRYNEYERSPEYKKRYE